MMDRRELHQKSRSPTRPGDRQAVTWQPVLNTTETDDPGASEVAKEGCTQGLERGTLCNVSRLIACKSGDERMDVTVQGRRRLGSRATKLVQALKASPTDARSVGLRLRTALQVRDHPTWRLGRYIMMCPICSTL